VGIRTTYIMLIAAERKVNKRSGAWKTLMSVGLRDSAIAPGKALGFGGKREGGQPGLVVAF